MTDITLCAYDDAPKPGELTLCKVGDHEIVLTNVDGEFYAVDNACPHTGGPLADGELNGPMLECPWHFAVFDVRTGELIEGLALSPAKTYRVRVEEGEVRASLPDEV